MSYTSSFFGTIKNIATYFCLFFLTGFFLVGCDETTESDVNLLQHAREAIESGDFRTGGVDLKNLLQKDPKNPEARILLGKLYLDTGEPASAEKEFLSARENSPSATKTAEIDALIAETFLHRGKYRDLLQKFPIEDFSLAGIRATFFRIRGDAYLALGEINAAESSFHEALANYKIDINEERPHLKLTEPPEFAEALTGLARVEIMRKNWDKSFELLDRAEKISANNPDIFGFRGNIYHSRGEYDKAEIEYRKAYELRPHKLLFEGELARALLANNKTDEAIIHLDNILSQLPDHVPTIHLRAIAAYKQKNYEAAKTFSERLQELAKFYTPSKLIAGASNFALGNYEQAYSLLQNYVAWAPHDTDAKKLLASTLLKMQNPGMALELLRPIVDTNTTDLELLSLVGTAASRSGNLLSASSYYKLAADAHPEDPRLQTRLAMSQIASGNHEAGIKQLEETIGRSPQDYTSRYTLLISHLRNKDYLKAKTIADEINSRDPDNVAAFIGAGLAEIGLKLTSEAIASFNKALELEPGHLGAAFALSDIYLSQKKFEETKQVYESVLALNPNSLPVLMRLIGLATYQNDEVAANLLIRRAMEAAPSAPEPRILAAENMLDQGEPLQAISILTDIARDAPEHPGILQVLGKAQMAAGKGAIAVRTLERLVNITPQAPHAHFLLAQAYAQIGSRNKMYDELDTALKIAPQNKLAAIALVRGLVIDNRLDEANKRLATFKEAMPDDDFDVMRLDAWVAMRQNRPADAVPLLRNLVAAHDLVEDKRQLVAALWKSGEKKGALSIQLAQVNNAPNDLRAAFELANYYLLDRKREEAAKIYEKIIVKVPNNVIALNNLADLLKNSEPDRAIQYAENAYKLSAGSPPATITLAELLINKPDTLDRGYNLIKGLSRRFPSVNEITIIFAKASILKGNKAEAKTLLTGIDMKSLSTEERGDITSMLEGLK